MMFYPSKVGDTLNRRPFYPESVDGRVMVNPNYKIKHLLKRERPWFCCRCQTQHVGPCVLCDSGAFQDIDTGVRLMQHSALERQLRFERVLAFRLDADDWHFEAVAIYDQMAGVDEVVVDGKKVKRRGTVETARPAIEETLRSAAYYASQRHRIQGHIMFVGQGVTADQYIDDCLVPMLDVMQDGDYFAFGGLCIWGRMRTKITPEAHKTITRALPLLHRRGIRRVHLLGVMFAEGVTWFAEQLHEYNRRLGAAWFTGSTDGSGPEQAGKAYGVRYVNGRQHRTGERKWQDYHPHDLAMENIKGYTEWIRGL